MPSVPHPLQDQKVLLSCPTKKKIGQEKKNLYAFRPEYPSIYNFPVPLKTFRPELEIPSVSKLGGNMIQPATGDSLRTHYCRADSFLQCVYLPTPADEHYEQPYTYYMYKKQHLL